MSTISEQIMEGMKVAMKAKDTITLNTLRALKTAMTNAAIAKGGLGTVLDEAEELAVVRKQLKQREDSVEQFRNAGRLELAEKEEAEMAVLAKFLPAALSDDEVCAILDAVIAETGAASKKDMGKVMKLMQERCAGRVDGKKLAQMVSARLS
ncbi:MAG: GatB/YqeY domain-containing protein [Akkermansia sp.]|nr:GatB/YqeY domain-containing protein [Akkermansia sp.]